MMGYEEEEHWADIRVWVGRLHPEDAVAAQANVERLLQTSIHLLRTNTACGMRMGPGGGSTTVALP